MNCNAHKKSLLAGVASLGLWLLLAAWQYPTGAAAQEALRNAIAADAVSATNRLINLATMPYTLKSGDFRLLVTPSLDAEWNDNINISRTDTLQDYILTPMLQLDANYPLTQVNLLRLNVGFGYAEYVDHSAYSNWRVNSGSELSFDTYIKDILINLHDRFDYSQDAGAQAIVAGVGTYGSEHNVAGISTGWNPKDLNLALGYDHENTMSTASQFQSQNSASDLIDGRVGWRFVPTATAGVEGTYSHTSYDQAILNNNSSYTAGLYGDWRPGNYFTVRPRVGYVLYEFGNTSQSAITTNFVLTGVPVQTANLNSWYADLSVTHQITRALSYSLSAGHEIQAGVQSDAVEDYYVRLSSTWEIIRRLNLQSSFSYERGQQGAGNIAGNLTEIYDWYNAGLDLSHQITSRLRVGLTSRVSFRTSTQASLEYTQVVIGLQMLYAFE